MHDLVHDCDSCIEHELSRSSLYEGGGVWGVGEEEETPPPKKKKKKIIKKKIINKLEIKKKKKKNQTGTFLSKPSTGLITQIITTHSRLIFTSQ